MTEVQHSSFAPVPQERQQISQLAAYDQSPQWWGKRVKQISWSFYDHAYYWSWGLLKLGGLGAEEGWVRSFSTGNSGVVSEEPVIMVMLLELHTASPLSSPLSKRAKWSRSCPMTWPSKQLLSRSDSVQKWNYYDEVRTGGSLSFCENENNCGLPGTVWEHESLEGLNGMQ